MKNIFADKIPLAVKHLVEIEKAARALRLHDAMEPEENGWDPYQGDLEVGAIRYVADKIRFEWKINRDRLLNELDQALNTYSTSDD